MRISWGKRLISLAVAGAMALSVPLGALAATFDLSDGDITVSAEKDEDTGEEVHWVDQRDDEGNQVEREETDEEDEKADYKELDEKDDSGTVTKTGRGYGFKKDKEIKIEQSNQTDENSGDQTETSGEEKTATDNTVTIKAEEGTEVEVTLDNVNIEVGKNEDKAAVKVEAAEGSTVELELDGDNVVKSGGDHAGVEKNGTHEETGTLVIKDDNSDGSLTAKAGSFNAACIGGAKGETGSNITINGGTITAKAEITESSYYGWGAGIGGGAAANGEYITINGGNITAMSAGRGAGIGGGGSSESTAIAGNGDHITITGGKVTVLSPSDILSAACWGAGIGGGSANVQEGSLGGGNGTNITITGGTVTTKGSTRGAGIGGGRGGNGENITITGGEVYASASSISDGYPAAIGGGQGVVWVSYPGENGETKWKQINDVLGGAAKNITISGGYVEATGGGYAAGIGSGTNGEAGDITISGGEVIATGGDYGAGIGSGDSNVTGTITISGGDVKATGGQRGAGIGSGFCGDVNGTVAITGGTVTATGGTDGGSGIGSGRKGFYNDGSWIGGNVNGSIVISGNAVVNAYGGTSTNNEYGAGIGAGSKGNVNEGAQIVVKENAQVTAISAGDSAASIGAGANTRTDNNATYGQNNGAIKLLNKAKVILGVGSSTSSSETGYIGSGKNTTDGTQVADGSSASYEVDCTATINGNEVESTYRPDMSTTEWLWDSIKTYIHYTPGSIADNNGVYTNGNLKINCVDEINAYNSGVIRSDDPIAAQRWYWVTALFDADENVGYTYEQIGSNLIVNADEAAQAAVLHVLLTGWAEHTEVQSITFVTAGKTTTLYASEMLGITTGEQLTLTHEYEKATLAVDGRDYTYLLGEQAA